MQSLMNHEKTISYTEKKASYLEKQQAKPVTVLAVDDSPTVRALVTMTLERRGYRVVAASDGMEALARLQSQLPEVILLDITMPRMDGYKLCKIIRGNDELRHIPVVMLSGNDGLFDKVRGKMAGCSAYITKPFEPDMLIKEIEKYTGQLVNTRPERDEDGAAGHVPAERQGETTFDSMDQISGSQLPRQNDADRPFDGRTEPDTRPPEPVVRDSGHLPVSGSQAAAEKIKARCPSCGTVYKNIKAEHIGKYARCKRCSTKFCITVS